jgi:heptosyltransferase-2
MPKTLIIAPNWIGDAVMTEPFLRHLSQYSQDITILASPWVAPVYRAIPAIRKVVEVDFSHGKIELSKRRQIAKALAQESFDQAFVLPNSWKSIIIPVLAKIPQIYGYQGELRSPLLSQYLPNPPKKNRPPMVEHYCSLIHLVSPLNVCDPSFKRPQLQIDPKTQNQSLSILEPLDCPQYFYIFAPGAEYGPAKQWPSKHYATLAEEILLKDPSCHVLLMGSSKDKVICEQILQATDTSLHSKIHNLCGLVTLDQSIALISLAHGMASNDSGLMHIAAALSIPQVAFYGSSDPKHTPPLSPYARILFLGLDCSPCHQRKCPLGHLDCLNLITPQSAFEELNRSVTLRNHH